MAYTIRPTLAGSAAAARRAASSRAATKASAARVAFSTATSTPPKEYTKLCEQLQEISTISGVTGLLAWDEQVMMPSGAAGVRAKQTSTLAGIIHEKSTDPALGATIEALLPALEGGDLSASEKAVIRDAHRNYTKATAVPKAMAQRIAELGSRGFQSWAKARAESDFSVFQPVLSEWVDVTREKCALVDPNTAAYDVCLDDFERGMTAARLDEVFGEVREGLVPLLAAIRAAPGGPSAEALAGTFDTKAQAALCETIAKEMGFNTDRGRLDVSAHPFTGGSHPMDVRMTTRFKEGDLTEGLTGAIHETGHALYEQGRNPEYEGLPVGEALSMGVHESQSLFWERMVALSPSFSSYLLPQLQAAFPGQLPPSLDAAGLYGALNVVKPPSRSMIRVEADEVTYPLHIILRYELEQGLISGELAVKDLPEMWDAKMQEYLGCTPGSAAEGVLQDVHWGAGCFGYFPTYSLGAMYACQLYKHAGSQVEGLEEQIAKGDFRPVRECDETL
mmetsp:Transcript_39148/g.124614  ORF Transcript_39148/g.124614 Transcript_39148/m.124614 type:complete len:506 (-) Transcript_39148:129-1646(-)